MLFCFFLPTTSFQFKSILVHDGAALVSELSQFINPDCVLHVIQMLIFNPGLRQLYIPTTEQDDTITRRRPVQANRIHFFFLLQKHTVEDNGSQGSATAIPRSPAQTHLLCTPSIETLWGGRTLFLPLPRLINHCHSYTHLQFIPWELNPPSTQNYSSNI